MADKGWGKFFEDFAALDLDSDMTRAVDPKMLAAAVDIAKQMNAQMAPQPHSITGKDVSTLITDELLEEPELRRARLVREFSNWVKEGDTASFMVVAPMSLTAKLRDDTYRNLAFIGGEGFDPVGLKIGAKMQLIVILAPSEASDFVSIEVPYSKFTEVFGEEVSQGLGSLLLPSGTLDDQWEQASYVPKQTPTVAVAEKPKYENFGEWS